ncbi:MAG: zf-HC2 domain-containing protein [Candidatus Tectomicrobia bacterium]|nr:zf-HC2 domain-containing protein [Candidatus Tectomicrobia bacterium]
MECLDTETLCMYMDDELDAAAREAVEAVLSTCQHCAERLQSLREHDTLLQNAWLSAAPASLSSCDDGDPQQLSGYASQQLPAEEMARVEQHLRTCDACLQDVLSMRRMMRLLHREPLLTPPPGLVAQVRAGFATTPRPTVVEQLGTLVVQVAQNGLKFVESLGLPEEVRFAVGGQLAPAGAFRSPRDDPDAAALIDLRQSVGDLDLHLQVLHEDGDTVLLHIELQKQARPIAKTRVALVSGGRTRSSSRTSDAGEVDFPRLPPGDYTVRVPQENVETQLILRPL